MKKSPLSCDLHVINNAHNLKPQEALQFLLSEASPLENGQKEKLHEEKGKECFMLDILRTFWLILCLVHQATLIELMAIDSL